MQRVVTKRAGDVEGVLDGIFRRCGLDVYAMATSELGYRLPPFMPRSRTATASLRRLRPAFTDAMLAFVLVLVLVLVFQVARQIKIDTGDLGGQKVRADIAVVEALVGTLPDVEILKESETTRVITFGASTLFAPASASVQPTGQAILQRLATEITSRDVTRERGGTLYQIEVSGHTDNTRINTYQFQSNWELSTAGASNVVRFLAEQGGIDAATRQDVGGGLRRVRTRRARTTRASRARGQPAASR